MVSTLWERSLNSSVYLPIIYIQVSRSSSTAEEMQNFYCQFLKMVRNDFTTEPFGVTLVVSKRNLPSMTDLICIILFRSLKSFLLLTPWSSVVSWAFLVSGAVVYTLNASKTSTKTQLLLDAIESSENPYNANLEKIISSTTISSILVIVSILVGVVASWIHIKGVLGGHLWGSSTRLIFISLLTIGLLYLVGCFSWCVDGFWDLNQFL